MYEDAYLESDYEDRYSDYDSTYYDDEEYAYAGAEVYESYPNLYNYVTE